MKTSSRKKQQKPSKCELIRVFALYSCGSSLGGYPELPLTALNDCCGWFLANLAGLQRAGSKTNTIIEQVLIAYPTPPGALGNKLLRKALRKQSLGPVFVMTREGRKCEPFTREHAERPQRNYVELGIVCNLEDEFIDDSGKRHQIGEFIGVFDSTKSSLHPGNITVFRARA